MKLSETLNLFKEEQIDAFLKKYTNYSLNEKNISKNDIESNWHFLGDSESNAAQVNILKTGEKGLIERLTNAIDSVIEKNIVTNGVVKPQTATDVIKKSFPQYYQKKTEVKFGERILARDAANQVILVVNDGSKSNKPTFDVIDKGTGIKGDNFGKTILSLNHGNKLSSDKSYLIGAFGQGGSTSLPFTYATLVFSKFQGSIYFTVIRSVDLVDYKNNPYVYMAIDGKIASLEIDCTNGFEENINDFITSESGTLIRMIETDISKKLRDNQVAKAGMLGDYIGSELFNVGLPVRIVDNRADYRDNSSSQNRYAHGTFMKLQTTAHVKPEYSGTISIYHNNHPYKVDYYTILPLKEKDWGKDSECKNVFAQFNTSLNPIIYTVNGQTITSENYTKLNNAGLTYLRYRLLVVIDLDGLGNEKYKFFTSDRAQIKSTDLSSGFVDKVIQALVECDKLKEINNIIAQKSISSTVDQEMIDTISKNVKDLYTKLLVPGGLIPKRVHPHDGPTKNEVVFYDHIVDFTIVNSKTRFYRDQRFNIDLQTNATKNVNAAALVYLYIDDSAYYDFVKNTMGGHIEFEMDATRLSIGSHKAYCQLFDNSKMVRQSNVFDFEIADEKTPDPKQIEKKKLDLKVTLVKYSDLICNVSKNEVENKLLVELCLDHDEMITEIYGKSKSTDQIATIKERIIQPIALFSLLYEETYNSLDTEEEKNKLVIAYVKSVVSSFQNQSKVI